MDLDLRKLRYFVAVAGALHFGRAADELYIAQPVLSRQIRALEQDLGTPLLTRDSHGVALRRRVTVAAQGVQRLMVGFRAGIAVAPAVRLFAARYPDVLVDVQRIEGDDQAPMLLDGRIDVGYVRLPLAEAGLRVAPLYTEPRVAVLPAGHELADREQITEADLAGEPLVWHGDASTHPTKRPHPDSGYLVRGVDETLEHVAAGRGISFLARSATVFYSHPNISYVPVSDLASDQVCLAVAASHTSPVVDDFFTAAQTAAEVTAECGNHEMWQLGSGAVPMR
jgi:DNA-binding transcriptional LysR family regulator